MMKRHIAISLLLFAIATPAPSQEVFDPVRKGEAPAVKFGSDSRDSAARRGNREVAADLREKGARPPEPGERWHGSISRAACQGSATPSPRPAGQVQGLKAAAGAPPVDERAVIEKVIRDSIGWALTKDRPLAESTMVHDESLYIVNPASEPTAGWSQLVKNFDFWMDPRFKATKCEVWDMRIGVARSGDVAWWSCMLNDLAEWDGKPTGWRDTRWTGVMEKRDGRWLIVQMHFSFASDKVAAQVKAKLEAEKAERQRK